MEVLKHSKVVSSCVCNDYWTRHFPCSGHSERSAGLWLAGLGPWLWWDAGVSATWHGFLTRKRSTIIEEGSVEACQVVKNYSHYYALLDNQIEMWVGRWIEGSDAPGKCRAEDSNLDRWDLKPWGWTRTKGRTLRHTIDHKEGVARR